MAEKDNGRGGDVNLEMPSLFRRRKRAAKATEPEAVEPKPPPVKLPAVDAMTASVLTGVLVGLLACGATYLAMQGCEAIKGTSSCGGGPGFFLLVVIVVGLVLAGGLVMEAFRVTDPASTSFLAVGLLAVIVLLFLMEVIFEWWMVIAIPVTGAVTFAASHWVTTTFVEPGDRAK